MTKEDALEIWLPIIKMGVKSMPECYEAIDMAIKALEQEPCVDAISREDALMALTGEWKESLIEILPKAIKRINELPPVNPAEKVGHWIDHQEDRWIYAKCSECETVHDTRTNYCPNCGAKMQEVEE